ncbi:hypothetical protein J5N97_015102 [Dioscorea zingiberensis]|uniref:Transmembrane protein n=1 Tax=Dioscorea zingiberensis TaxID=325984 RepID=A0A9D5CWE7_9LILI|nr:hypothetical protein J5N97_015102 [Dioscorea zingiberensis]
MESSIHPGRLQLPCLPPNRGAGSLQTSVSPIIALKRNRRTRKPIISNLRRAISFAASLRKIYLRPRLMDLLLQQGGGNGGGGGLGIRGGDSGGGDWFERSVKGSGFLELLISLALAAAFSKNAGSRKKYLGTGVLLISAMMGLKNRVWRSRRAGIFFFVTVVAFLVFMYSSNRRRRRAFWRS